MQRDTFHTDIESLRKLVPIGTQWEHRKGGTYVVRGVVMIESTMTLAIAYSNDGVTWVRPASEFLDGRFRRKSPQHVVNRLWNWTRETR